MSARTCDCSEFWYWVPSATNASRNLTHNVRDSIVIFKVVLHFYLHYSNNDKNTLFYLKSTCTTIQVLEFIYVFEHLFCDNFCDNFLSHIHIIFTLSLYAFVFVQIPIFFFVNYDCHKNYQLKGGSNNTPH